MKKKRRITNRCLTFFWCFSFDISNSGTSLLTVYRESRQVVKKIGVCQPQPINSRLISINSATLWCKANALVCIKTTNINCLCLEKVILWSETSKQNQSYESLSVCARPTRRFAHFRPTKVKSKSATRSWRNNVHRVRICWNLNRKLNKKWNLVQKLKRE